MRNNSGMVLILVMGLLLLLTLMGVGLMSQAIKGTKFYEAASISYTGLLQAQQNLDKMTITDLVAATGSDANGVITVLYAVPMPAIGGSEHGTLTGNVWRPGTCKEFYQNYRYKWTITSDGATVTDTYNYTGKGLDESPFLFKDGAGTNDADVLSTWSSYIYHVDFNAALSPQFGVYFNAGAVNNDPFKDITGYIFLISPLDDTFSITQVHNGKLNPGHDKSTSFSSVQDPDGNSPFSGWTAGNSMGVGAPFDSWHGIDISVSSDGTVITSVDGVQIFSYPGASNPHMQPNLVGLTNFSGNNWGTTTSDPSQVSFKNISVTNTSP